MFQKYLVLNTEATEAVPFYTKTAATRFNKRQETPGTVMERIEKDGPWFIVN